MKNKAIILVILLTLIISPLGVAHADCDDHLEGVCIALGATMFLNTILYGIPSPVVPPAATCCAPRRPVYYRSYCPPAVVEHYHYYYDYPPRINIWIENDPPCRYRPYWRRHRIYNYNYNYNYHYHYHYRRKPCRDREYYAPRHRHDRYCDPYNGNCYYRPQRYIRY